MTINNGGKYFSGRVDQKRLSCEHCGDSGMDDQFMIDANKARKYADVPMVVNSGARCPVHNKKIGGVANSSHVVNIKTGRKSRAMDVKALNWWMVFKIVYGLIRAGFERIFIYITISKTLRIKPKHIHFDGDKTKPQELIGIKTYRKGKSGGN